MNYKTKLKIFGLPIIHIATGNIEENGRYKRNVAKGWIAIGDISFGVLFSFGTIAFGGIALGGFGVGLLTFAGVAAGGFAWGGFAVGILACGGGAIGLLSASGGLAIAYEYAQGGLAIAKHANDQLAANYFECNRYHVIARILSTQSRWLIYLALIPLGMNLINTIKKKHITNRKTSDSNNSSLST